MVPKNSAITNNPQKIDLESLAIISVYKDYHKGAWKIVDDIEEDDEVREENPYAMMVVDQGGEGLMRLKRKFQFLSNKSRLSDQTFSVLLQQCLDWQGKPDKDKPKATDGFKRIKPNNKVFTLKTLTKIKVHDISDKVLRGDHHEIKINTNHWICLLEQLPIELRKELFQDVYLYLKNAEVWPPKNNEVPMKFQNYLQGYLYLLWPYFFKANPILKLQG